jgi:hypothetical protein
MKLHTVKDFAGNQSDSVFSNIEKYRPTVYEILSKNVSH